jgi:predicted ArsR family transcriptional regulator
MKDGKAYVDCAHCGGTGRVKLSGVYADTLALLITRPGLNGAELAKVFGCKATAMNNRLKALERHGLARGKRYGRQITGRAVWVPATS